jgi:hypothetical protein
MSKHLTDPFGKLVEGQAGDLPCQFEAIPCAALGANVTTTLEPIVKPESIIPATDRAWTMTVLQEPAVQSKGRQDLPPMPLGDVSGLTHGGEAPAVASNGWDCVFHKMFAQSTTFRPQSIR